MDSIIPRLKVLCFLGVGEAAEERNVGGFFHFHAQDALSAGLSSRPDPLKFCVQATVPPQTQHTILSQVKLSNAPGYFTINTRLVHRTATARRGTIALTMV
jgi:hypothetical protein